MSTILIATPVLARPQRAAQVVAAAREGTTVPFKLLFLCSPGDHEQIAACQEQAGGEVEVVTVTWECGHGDYAKKINAACRIAREAGIPWVFTGADDLCFCPMWAENAIECARGFGMKVVGTNDLGNARVVSGEHSTHSLVATDYVFEHGTIDEKGKLYHEGYGHQYVDDEMVSTARVRRVYTACPNSEVPHLHPNWGKGSNDATYDKGQSTLWQDKELFESREPLWTRNYRR